MFHLILVYTKYEICYVDNNITLPVYRHMTSITHINIKT